MKLQKLSVTLSKYAEEGRNKFKEMHKASIAYRKWRNEWIKTNSKQYENL